MIEDIGSPGSGIGDRAGAAAPRFRDEARLVEQFVALQDELLVPGRSAAEGVVDALPARPAAAFSGAPAQRLRRGRTARRRSSAGPARWSSHGK